MEIFSYLKNHTLFKNLTDKTIKEISFISKVSVCNEGSVLFYQNDSCEKLYLIISGDFCGESTNKENKTHYFNNDYINFDKQKGSKHEETLVSRTRGHYISLPIYEFSELLKNKKTKKRIKPIYDGLGLTISGINYCPISKSKKNIKSSIIWRKSSFFLFEKLFYPTLFLIGILLLSKSGLSFNWDILLYKILTSATLIYTFIQLILWLSEKYILTNKSISYFRIQFRTLKIKKHILPLDQVRGISIEKKKFKYRFFKVGSIILQTSAGKSLKVENVDKPTSIEKKIEYCMKNIQDKAEHNDKIVIREKMDLYFKNKDIDDKNKKKVSEKSILTEKTFKKSTFCLFINTWWQLFLIIGLSISSYLFRHSGGSYFTVLILPLSAVLLWRFQDWRNDLYKISNGKIIDINKKPFGKSISTNLADINFVTNIYSEKIGLVQYLFDYGKVHIETAGGNIIFSDVHSPLKVQDELLNLRESWKEITAKKNKESQFQDFLTYSEVYKQAEDQNRINRFSPSFSEDLLAGVEK